MRGDQRPPRQESAAEGAAIAAFGGGTGLHSLLKGIKAFTSNITAIVAVSDDGGSSGILRKEFDMPPPGDMRNCLVALADEESLMAELFRYRFENSELGGHSFGNIFITALAEVTGDFGKAIQLANKILSVRGRVLPATLDKVSLEAVHDDDSKTTGETRISKSGKRIRRLNLRPSPGRPTPQALEAVRRADILLFGPGSLFTSILPPIRDAWGLPAPSEPRKYWSGQRLGELFVALADDTPPQYTSPYTPMAKAKLGEALLACVEYYEQYGEAGFREFVGRILKQKADDVRDIMRRNPFL